MTDEIKDEYEKWISYDDELFKFVNKENGIKTFLKMANKYKEIKATLDKNIRDDERNKIKRDIDMDISNFTEWMLDLDKKIRDDERSKAVENCEAILFDLFNGKIKWDCQCPPENRGARIVLVKLLTGCDWETANKITFNATTTNELCMALNAAYKKKVKK